MLHFNAASAPGSGPSSAGSVHSQQQQQQQNGRDETYKVLVLDSFTKDIIAPLLKVGGADQLKWKQTPQAGNTDADNVSMCSRRNDGSCRKRSCSGCTSAPSRADFCTKVRSLARLGCACAAGSDPAEPHSVPGSGSKHCVYLCHAVRLLNPASRHVLRSLHWRVPTCAPLPHNRTDRGDGQPLSGRLQVAELRRHGVTLTLSLERPREPIPDVPAVYFLTATEANMAAVVSCTERCVQKLRLGVHHSRCLFGRPDSAGGTAVKIVLFVYSEGVPSLHASCPARGCPFAPQLCTPQLSSSCVQLSCPSHACSVMPAAQGMLHSTWQPNFKFSRLLPNHLQADIADGDAMFIQSMFATAECSDPYAAVPGCVLLAAQKHLLYAQLLMPSVASFDSLHCNLKVWPLALGLCHTACRSTATKPSSAAARTPGLKPAPDRPLCLQVSRAPPSVSHSVHCGPAACSWLSSLCLHLSVALSVYRSMMPPPIKEKASCWLC